MKDKREREGTKIKAKGGWDEEKKGMRWQIQQRKEMAWKRRDERKRGMRWRRDNRQKKMTKEGWDEKEESTAEEREGWEKGNHLSQRACAVGIHHSPYMWYMQWSMWWYESERGKMMRAETELTAAPPNTRHWSSTAVQQHQRLTAINEACSYVVQNWRRIKKFSTVQTQCNGEIYIVCEIFSMTFERVNRNKSSPMWASPKRVVIFKVSIITIWTTICNYVMSFTSKARSDLWDGVWGKVSLQHII